MRPTTLLSTILSTTLLTTHAQLIPFLIKGEPQSPYNGLNLDPNSPPPSNQNPMAPPSPESATTNSITLSDILPTHPLISIFASLTQAQTTVSTRLESKLQNTTLLAPKNTAMTALPHKPWEDPREYAALGSTAYTGTTGEERAARNMRRFVEAHVVPVSPWEEGQKVETLGGGKVWWEMKGGKQVVMPGEIGVEKVVGGVGNGEVWVLEKVVNYAV